MKIDYKNLKPIRYNDRKVVDPPRHPKVIIPLENQMKKSFEFQLNKMVVDLTKEMVEIKKGNEKSLSNNSK